jgi:glycosyltransferase involved in cell wall biosynthesis
LTIFKKIYAVKCSIKLTRIKSKNYEKNNIKKLKNLSIVIPSKNEGPNLKYIIPKLKVLSSDIIIVDSNSQDNTKKICELNKVRYIIDNCLGKGDAQRIGVKSSIFENIIFFDAD